MTLTEIIARLEELDKAMNDGSLPVTARACYRWDLTNKLRTHARTLIAAGKCCDAMRKIAAYPPPGGRRTDDGYPSEIVYDEFAYKRMVDSYREAIKAALAELDRTIKD